MNTSIIMIPSEAAIRLRAYLIHRPRPDLAREVGVTSAAVATWTSGRSIPRPELRESLMPITGIEPEAWQRPASRAHVEALISEMDRLHTREIAQLRGELETFAGKE